MAVRWSSFHGGVWFVRAHLIGLVAAFIGLCSGGIALADSFTVRDDEGKLVAAEARLAGEGRGYLALERSDGRIELVPQDQIVKRVPTPDPKPMSRELVLERLTEEFGKDKFRGIAEQNYVIGIILAEPLPGKYEKTSTMLLNKGVTFMKTVEKVFLDFVDKLNLDLVKPKYPLVLLIFETDDEFIRYTTNVTGGRGLTAGNMLGYYSGLSNRLVIRMSECHTFETPLHEAIHQQVYNRGVLQRLSPAPAWFNEGIATGFEGGEKINTGPFKINARYARQAMKATNVDWDDVVADDKAFRGDVLAGEAYAHAWSIHWFLLTKYNKQYKDYLRLLSQKKTLEQDDAQTRVRDFENSFGKPVGKLQAEFPKALSFAANRQGVSLVMPKAPGYLLSQSNLAEVEMRVEPSREGVQAEGRMKNISHLRPMSFHITVETDSGTYGEWFLPNVAPLKEATLENIPVTKRMQNGPGGQSRSFSVRVRTAVPESDTALQWQRGQLPIPKYAGE